jgi:NitT/TauT family transport system substrate-binding protein
MKFLKMTAALLLAGSALLTSAVAETVRVASTKTGTVNWELRAIVEHGLDRQAGIELEILELADIGATRMAVQQGAADVAVADWMWVSRMRDEGHPFSFTPYSSSVGGLMVHPDSGIRTLKDLEGRKLGVVGGALSKGWLLLQALSEQEGVNLSSVEKVFGAPPLLSKELQARRVDAVITYWHFAAKLEAAGMQRLMELSEVAPRLGIEEQVPMLGYIFMEDWAKTRPDAVNGLIQASRSAKEFLATHPEAWNSLRPKMGAKNDAEFEQLKRGYLEGSPQPLTAAGVREAKTLFRIMGKIGGKKLIGDSTKLAEGTFWGVAEGES